MKRQLSVCWSLGCRSDQLLTWSHPHTFAKILLSGTVLGWASGGKLRGDELNPAHKNFPFSREGCKMEILKLPKGKNWLHLVETGRVPMG